MRESVRRARELAQATLDGARHLDQFKAYQRVCMVIRGLGVEMPDMVEKLDGSRRLIWPDDPPTKPRDPQLFDEPT